MDMSKVAMSNILCSNGIGYKSVDSIIRQFYGFEVDLSKECEDYQFYKYQRLIAKYILKDHKITGDKADVILSSATYCKVNMSNSIRDLQIIKDYHPIVLAIINLLKAIIGQY